MQDTGGEGGGTDGDPGSGDAAGQGGTFRTRVQLCGHHPLQIYGLISGSIPKGLSLEIEMSYIYAVDKLKRVHYGHVTLVTVKKLKQDNSFRSSLTDKMCFKAHLLT
jgi:hypothetical protein